MRILWLSWRDIKNPNSGGAEKIAFEITKCQIKDGHSITLFTSSFQNSKSNENLNGVNIIRRGNRLTCRFYSFLYYLQHKDFDLIIDEINTIPAFTPLFARRKSVTIIYQLAREYWFSEVPPIVSYLGYFLEPLYLKLYKNQKTITISNSTKDDLLELGFKNVHFMRVGLDFKPKLSLKSRQNLILFIGRLTKTKGPQDAIDAFKIIHQKYKDYKLIIIGRGDQTNKLNLSKNIEFRGFVSEKEKINLLEKAKIILIPAIREGWNLVATEANATGCVPIAYNVPGLRDSIINGKTGILVDRSPPNLAQAAIDLIENESKRQSLSQNGFEFAKNFSWINTYNDFKKIITNK